MSLEWTHGGKYYRESACKRYTVSKAIVAGSPVYDAWRVGSPADHLGTRLSFVGAQSLCEKHDARAHTEAA